MDILINILIVNYLGVLAVYMAHCIRWSLDPEFGFSKKDLVVLLIPFMFLICVVYLLLIIIINNIWR